MIQKINSGNTTAQKQNNNNKPKDPYSDDPLIRSLGYTNEFGAAIAPVAGPIVALLSYGPAIGYIAADTKDKFEKGDDDNYQKPSPKKGALTLIKQILASVILPTAAIKGGQVLANKVIDSKNCNPVKKSIKNFIEKHEKLNNIISKFSDKPEDVLKPAKSGFDKFKKSLAKFSKKFDHFMDYVTGAKWYSKNKLNKSGLRNVGSAIAGLATLALVAKPIDHFVEHLVSKSIKPTIETVESAIQPIFQIHNR